MNHHAARRHASQVELFQQASLLHRAGKLRDAERIYRAVLKIDPDHFASLYYLGLICAQQGLPDAAIPLFLAALKQNSQVPEVHNNLGMAFYALRRFEDAVGRYEKAIILDPLYAVAYNNLGTAFGALGRHDEAIARFTQALRIRSDYVEALNNIGTEYFTLGCYHEAIAYFSKAVAARPDFADAQVNLGNALLADSRPHEALKCYQRVLALRPLSMEVRLRIGDLLQAINRPQEAIACYEQALLNEPESVDIQLKLGNLLQVLNRHKDAVAAYQRVLAAHPEVTEAHDCLGFALAEIGNTAGARQAFENALRLEPLRAKSIFGLVNLGKITETEPVLPAIRRLATTLHSVTIPEQVLLHFALGKALADIGEHGSSFAHLLEGNALRRKEIVYDEAQTLSRFERVRAIFTPELMLSRRSRGNSSRQPIFILGMMRSGSTLVEQILASHPSVFAAGERLDFQEAFNETIGAAGDAFRQNDIASQLTDDMLSRIGSAYIERLGEAERMIRLGHLTGGSTGVRPDRIIDKLPANFLFVGLIHLVFPNAAIIHTRRDPIDTCLSCFANLFASAQPQTYELGELGRYYRGYAKLMAHWREALPPTAMLDVQYETLIDNFEGEAHRIVEYCGLKWNDGCLDFSRTQRPVRTASMAQVRQPIYRTSVGRPRPDDEALRPLLVGLGLLES